jgi:membrane protease YdiL (CAAX protease family)
VTEPRAVQASGSDRAFVFALWTALAAGCGLLVVRPALVGRSWTPRALLACYLVLGVAAVLSPVPGRTWRFLGPVVVTVAGVVAILIASSVSGPAFPLPRTGQILALNTVAAVSEELFFRRLVFGGLLRYGAVIAVCGSAAVFALVHVPIYGTAALPVDLGAGLLFSWQRWASGGWGASATTHVFANLMVVAR